MNKLTFKLEDFKELETGFTGEGPSPEEIVAVANARLAEMLPDLKEQVREELSKIVMIGTDGCASCDTGRVGLYVMNTVCTICREEE